jgi:PTS system fructose-specific IIA component
MSFADFLNPDCVVVAPTATDKWELIRQMAEVLCASGTFPAERLDEVNQALVARENSVSTGMEDGIAVPHAALDCVHTVHAAMSLIPNGIDFHTLDGNPAKIVVMLLVPRAEKLLHVRTLTEIARRLGDSSFRTRLLECTDGEGVQRLWT